MTAEIAAEIDAEIGRDSKPAKKRSFMQKAGSFVRGKGFKEGGVVRCVDKSDKPMKIKKTKKVAKRGQRGVGAAKRGFGRAVV